LRKNLKMRKGNETKLAPKRKKKKKRRRKTKKEELGEGTETEPEYY